MTRNGHVHPHETTITVMGVGGAGTNAISRMAARPPLAGVTFVAANTDRQALERSKADVKLTLGSDQTRGLGAGANPSVGRHAAQTCLATVRRLLRGVDLVFIVAGMGGGTGTGAAPVIAQAARDAGALAVAVVTRPFSFEGRQRQRQAEQGLAWLTEYADALITIRNDRLLDIADRRASLEEAFALADDVLRKAVEGIATLITAPGLINLDFADLRTVLAGQGRALLGVGEARGDEGPGRAERAVERALNSPLLDGDFSGAGALLLSLTGGESLALHEVAEAAARVTATAHEDADMIFGTVIDSTAHETVRATIVLTGFGSGNQSPAAAVPAEDASLKPDGEVARPHELRDLDIPSFLAP